jgi:hypothetical protein
MALLTILAAWPPVASGQVFGPGQAENARMLRMRREQAVAYVGPVARGLVETYGEEAVSALAMCSPAMGKKLADWFNAGQLDGQIPRPAAVLAAIGSPGAGDAVAWWCMQHASELQDIDACDAFLIDPVSYALHVKTLEAGAAQKRAFRLGAENGAPNGNAKNVDPYIAIAGSAFALVVVAVWWRRRRQQSLVGA